MARKILIALCVLFVMPVFVITGCDEVQENLTPKSSFIADFSCEYRKMNIRESCLQAVKNSSTFRLILRTRSAVCRLHTRVRILKFQGRI
mgnify:CR=1 FL=1